MLESAVVFVDAAVLGGLVVVVERLEGVEGLEGLERLEGLEVDGGEKGAGEVKVHCHSS